MERVISEKNRWLLSPWRKGRDGTGRSGWSTTTSLLPVLIPFLFFFMSGILVSLFQSLGFFQTGTAAGNVSSLAAYRDLFSSSWWRPSFLFSIKVALISSIISTVMGTVFGYGIWRLPRDLSEQASVFHVPLILPHISVAFVFLLIWSQTGILSSLLHRLGVITGYRDFPDILYRNNGVSLILAYIYKETAFVILLCLAVLKNFDRRLIITGRLLGAGEIRIFFKLVLPYLFPTMQTVFAILLVYSFGSFDIPFVLGTSSPGMIGVKTYDLYFHYDLSLRPQAMASIMLMFSFSIGCISALFISVRRFEKRWRGENN